MKTFEAATPSRVWSVPIKDGRLDNSRGPLVGFVEMSMEARGDGLQQ